MRAAAPAVLAVFLVLPLLAAAATPAPLAPNPAAWIAQGTVPADARAFADEALRGLLAPGEAVTHAVRAAQTATAAQARFAGVNLEVPSVASHVHAADAVAALLAAHGAAPVPLPSLPASVDVSLARTIDAYTTMDAAARLGPGAVFGARIALLDAALGLRDAVALQPVHASRVVVPGVLDLDLEGTDDVHAVDVALSIDIGGRDVYLNNAGGNNLLGGACAPASTAGSAALIDLAGDDVYGDPSLPVAARRGCGVIGGGYGGYGVGCLLDATGNDLYAAGDWAANAGATREGFGFLLDAQGDDAYVAGDHAVNGGGELPGWALLLDAGGSDRYLAGGYAANGGGYGASLEDQRDGIGVLLDASG
ncbi:MAG: hypothetical protein LC624_05420, partial [Halobacteriales archaeon]|nr:hypothetical protein [Halobacteriales archaeon]